MSNSNCQCDSNPDKCANECNINNTNLHDRKNCYYCSFDHICICKAIEKVNLLPKIEEILNKYSNTNNNISDETKEKVQKIANKLQSY